MAGSSTDRRPSKRLDPVAQRIAAALGETTPQPLAHIGRLVAIVGEERVLRFLERAHDVERESGLLRPDGNRRTLGGVFFKLAKEQTSAEERKLVWPPKPRRPKRPATADPPQDGTTPPAGDGGPKRAEPG